MSFLKGLLSNLVGDTAKPEQSRPDTAVPRFVHWLPYRGYDPKPSRKLTRITGWIASRC